MQFKDWLKIIKNNPRDKTDLSVFSDWCEENGYYEAQEIVRWMLTNPCPYNPSRIYSWFDFYEWNSKEIPKNVYEHMPLPQPISSGVSLSDFKIDSAPVKIYSSSKESEKAYKIGCVAALERALAP